MNPWRRRPADPSTPDEGVTPEDIAWRIGASEVRPAHHDAEEAAALAIVAAQGIGAESAAAEAASEPTRARAAGRAGRMASAGGVAVAPILQPRPLARPAHTVRRNLRVSGHGDLADADRVPRRLTLWRDVSALLFGVVAVALIAQLASGNGGNGGKAGLANPTQRTTPIPSQVATEASPTSMPRATPGVTLGPAINPSLIPVILAPSTRAPASRPPTPAVTPRPSPPAAVTLPPTGLQTPTASSIGTPTATPTASSIATPGPAVAAIACDTPVGLAVTCHDHSLNAAAGSEAWSSTGSYLVTDGGNGQTFVVLTYSGSGTYTVSLEVTGADGSVSSSSADVGPG